MGKIDNPIDRFCRSPLRKQNIIFNYAEALWYLSGRNDLEFIEYYAPSIRKYSADGRTLPGTGYGTKMLHFGTGNLNQLQRAVDLLTHDDPDSKRVFIQIFDANEDLYRRNIDVSCTLGLQFLLRENKLHAIAFMRANDAYVGLLSDIFSFTFIQEYLASVLGCGIGSYSHSVGSLHIYDENLESVDAIVRSDGAPISEQTPPRMPAGCNSEVINEVLRYEHSIRSGALALHDIRNIEELDQYWRDILALFCIHRMLRNHDSVEPEAFASLHPLHRAFVLNRWGHDGRIRHH